MNKKYKQSIKVILGFTIMSILVLVIVNNNYLYSEHSINTTTINLGDSEILNKEVEEELDEEIEEVVVEERIETIEVSAIGDLLMHIDIVHAMYNWETGEYNFDYNFELIKEYLDKADISIANLETTLAGGDYGYSGYPSFNTPDALAETMKRVGIDIVNNISNHTLDMGADGFIRTREVLKNNELDIIGTREKDQDRYIIKDVRGVKVGVIGYSYTTEGYYGEPGLNGIPIPEHLIEQMNIFNPYDLEKSFDEMKNQIQSMREDGADSIIFYMHWGEEYQLEPNDSQIKLAQFLANEEVDIVFGDHPHTIQPIDMVKSNNSDHETVVIYSLGNFLSSQRTESIGNPYTEDGLIVSVEITKNFATGEINIGVPKYTPTWVKLNIINGQYYYQVVPAEKSEVDYLDYYQSGRAIESFNRTSGIVEGYGESLQVWTIE